MRRRVGSQAHQALVTCRLHRSNEQVVCPHVLLAKRLNLRSRLGLVIVEDRRIGRVSVLSSTLLPRWRQASRKVLVCGRYTSCIVDEPWEHVGRVDLAVVKALWVLEDVRMPSKVHLRSLRAR